MINKGTYTRCISNQSVKQKTIVVFGVARSGTTMVANVLDKLGVYMGITETSIVYENFDVYGRLENGHIDSFKKYVEDQNMTYDLWGWKRPKSIEYISEFEPIIRNPHYIIPFRDVLAIALRNNISVNTDVIKNLTNTHNIEYQKVIDFVTQNNKPILLFSYEKAITNREYFVRELAEFVGINDEVAIQSAIQSIEPNQKEYVAHNVGEKISGKYKGRIDRINENRIKGWVKSPKDDLPVSIKLIINDDKSYGPYVANQERKDLTAAGIGDHAFDISLLELDLEPNKEHKISVLLPDEELLKFSPIKYVMT